MKKLPAVLTVFVAVFLIAVGTSILSIAIYSRFQKSERVNAHAWIHNQLELTAKQHKALDPIEKRYREKCHDLKQQLRLGNMELAEAMLADRKDSQRVHEAIEKIHAAIGELQNVIIGHIFEMQGALTPGQYDRLLHLTADALCNLDSEHG